MTESQPMEKDTAPRRWILSTFGLAFGLAVLLVVIVFAAVMALESPANRRAAVQAASIATVTPSGDTALAAPEQTVTTAPTATAGPTQTPVAKTMSAVSAPASTALPVDEAILSNLALRKIAQASTGTPLPTATPAPTIVKPAARPAAVRVTAVAKPSTPAQLPAATVTPIRQLDFSFYVKEACANERSKQLLKLMITAHGGIPPYDYYNDATQLGHAVKGSVVLDVKAAYGNPVPFKLIVVDSSGQRYSETFFWKSTRRCSWKPQ
jgi:hypothetical protein